MKKLTLSILYVAVALSASAQKLDRSIRPKPGPAPEVKLGEPQSFTLPNGLKVFVVEKHKLPVVSISIQLDIKPALEGNKTGYRQMMSELLTSGTKTRSSEQLAKEIDYMGANISATNESVYASGLKKHVGKMLELMSDITINSDFKQDELDKIKKRTLSGLEASKNEPDDMLNNVSAVVNFGTQHPYGEVTTDATVNNITLEDCKKYYSTYFRPNVAYMAVIGDITVGEAKGLIEKYFKNWEKAEVPSANYSNPTAPSKANVAFVPREGAVQSVINVTYPIDLLPGTPDVIKARVANSILGGGSNGRLFLNLREKHAWTYGSYSSINQDELKGNFTAYAKCRNAVSDSSVNEIIAEMKRLQNEKVGAEELQNHLSYLSGSFAIGLENAQTIAQYAINIERYKMPKDYYQNYLKNLNAVTADDIQMIARKYVNADKANIVVVGAKGDVDKSLVRFDSDGKIDYYDNYGNILKNTEAKAAPAGITVDAIMKKYVAAIGGEKALTSIKDIKTVSKAKMDAGGQQMTLTITEMKKNGKLKSTVEAMGMTFQKKVFDGSKGYEEAQGQKQDMDADAIAEAKQEADITAELHPEKYANKRTLKGMENVNGNDVYAVENVDAKGKKSTEYYDAKTGLLVKSVATEEAQGQSMTIVTEYSDYKEVAGANGYKIPYSIKQSVGGQSIPAVVETVEINKNIPDSEFN
ncbi:MAG: insulinase family protein [Chitinophagales bacterium]|nr:insulinase family protein [Chitinophagales bacterium]